MTEVDGSAESTGGGEAVGPPVPSEAARTLYLAILGAGGRLASQEADPADQESVAELLDLGLLTAEPDQSGYTAVNPRSVGGRLSEELRSAGTRLLVQAQEMPALLEDLTKAYDLTPRKVDRSGEVRHLHSAEEIRLLLDRLNEEAREEILSAQPGGPMPPHLAEEAIGRSAAFLARGGGVRALYEPAARSDGPTTAYVLAATELGVRFRVLGESFKRMIIFDRATVLIPSSPDYASAALVEDPAVVAFLVGMFERDWQRAEPVQWSAATPDTGGLPVHAQVGRLLSQGLTQRMIATRLGLSERTVAGHISRLRELYDAETLFQLGWLMRSAAGEGRQA
ncbi:LuxR C-terminal-related transcriptional regulator [Kitasatospora sp. NBC_01287]|uniref:LuxR C-terminal-related transcriptional regulator n=1 Tax=Kitasatospora sp. NBC_01287 TaxID=2903573 RepID=UPI0022553010|nr:LuxR C-terminal-related transcriptional regulator [Kitasatospora sp. NBC_01287]MCX4747562.1 LuxR C-terminal-related transcriptional regulator [Kitasatospora sp. NBC_01287]